MCSVPAADVTNLVEKIQEDVLAIVQWIQRNGIHLYIDKSSAMFVDSQFHVISLSTNLFHLLELVTRQCNTS